MAKGATTSTSTSSVTNVPLHTSFGISAVAACIAEATTLPLDTAKVRLQLQSLASKGEKRVLKYKGPFNTIRTMVIEEGAKSLFNGFIPGLHRQFLFTGIRLGLYDKIKGVIVEDGTPSLWERIFIAVFTSGCGITIANPADVLKVRHQAVNSQISGRRTGIMSQYYKVAKEEGLAGGLYKGYFANLTRNSLISASEIISYEAAKNMLLEYKPSDSNGQEYMAMVPIIAGCYAGFVATAVGNPADVIGTKVMQKHGPYAGMSIYQAASKMMYKEGFLSFYKGFWPNFCRIGSFNIIMWSSYEEIKKIILS